MEIDRRILRVCTVVLVGVLVLRLVGGNLSGRGAQEDLMSALLFLQTGRVVRLADKIEQEPEPTQPVPVETVLQPVVFTALDGESIRVNSYSGDAVDMQTLLQKPLNWSLKGEEPTVLIVHTHASESYTNTEGYSESSEYRTLDEAYNMVSIGAYLAQLLEAEGIHVVHDRTLHDYPSYNGSYEQSRNSVKSYLEMYPSITLVLDLHRDAMVDGMGNQIGYTVDTGQQPAAKLMLVVGAWNDNWQENMALAGKLHSQLEKLCPEICRPICLRSSRFNQDLSAGSLLIEVGAAGNTRQEALRSAEILAEAILSLSAGAVYIN